MKKHFALFATTFFLSTAAVVAAEPMAYTAKASTSQASLQVKEVNSSLIEKLQLNENQYIQLRALYSQYKEDVSKLKNSSQEKTALGELNKHYYAEVAKILTDEQFKEYKASSQDVKTTKI